MENTLMLTDHNPFFTEDQNVLQVGDRNVRKKKKQTNKRVIFLYFDTDKLTCLRPSI